MQREISLTVLMEKKYQLDIGGLKRLMPSWYLKRLNDYSKPDNMWQATYCS